MSASQTETLTLRARMKKLADNISDNSPNYALLKEHGLITKGSGGRTIFRELDAFQNTNFKRFYGGEQLPISNPDFATAAEMDWSQFAGSYTVTGRERLENEGVGRSIDLVPAKMRNLEKTLMNYVNFDVISDGTTDSGKQIKGFAAQIKKDPTTGTLAGIDQSLTANAYYRNYKFDTVNDGGAALSSSNALRYIRTCLRNTTRLSDKTKAIIAGDDYYSIFEDVAQSFQVGQVPVKGKLFDLGFAAFAINGVPVLLGGGVNFSGLAQLQTDLAYGVNPSALELIQHKNCWMTPLEKRFSTNQDVEVQIVASMWAMISHTPKLDFVLFDQ